MRAFRRFGLAAVVVGAASAPAFGQIGGGGGTGGGLGGTGGGLGGTGGGLGGGSGGGGLGGGGGGGGNTSTQGANLATMQAPPTITSASSSAYGSSNSSNTVIDSSNFFRNTYGNPYYPGRAGAQITQGPGGFGSVLYTSTSGRGGGNIGFSGTIGG